MSDLDANVRAMAQEIASQILAHLQQADRPVPAEYLTAAQVAQMTGFSPKALEAMRSRREGPRYLKVGASVRYRVADVRAWIEGGAQS